ncbi:bifunctional RNase H/acid phosphatase [Sphaerisporangium siamense]|uniref:Putative phosphoglycerate mutase n=1 Tax=Sphaerisporangium siamense TaxID=795645 RepID=A0A7W7DB00_9ACTN|nr:histidine phosphatase family protein [Sphaerisporangium siamense]MBB4702665.1 putative phosphoglycerate mutase [Sphaerisporangium siamense]GII83581.1 bifunctional RNase H/acid phosphatase [Sphaerisporangium siamense]
MNLVVEADGGSRGNPGPAGYGAVVKDTDGQVLAEAADALGVTTNNVAEYQGLIAGLRSVLALAGDGTAVEVRMDSKLVIEQMAGRWKIKNEGLRPLALEARGLAGRLRVTWRWIPRERNRDADRLANEAMDAAAKGTHWQSKTFPSPPGTPGPGTSISGGPGRGALPSDAAGSGGLGSGGAGTGGPGSSAPGMAASGPTASGSRTAGAKTATRAARGSASNAGRAGTTEALFDIPSSAAETAAPEATAGEVVTSSVSAEQARVVAAKPAATSGWQAPAPATSLLLLRHGETPFSIDRRFSGTGDPDLTPAGVAQAEAAAARLSRPPYAVEVIVSSPLRRARQTAEAVAARTGLTVAVDEGLREVDFGDWEGHTFTEIQRRWPGELAAWLDDPSVAPPGGESFDRAAIRVEEARERLLADYQGKNILVVSHVTPIKLLLSSALLAPLAALYRMHLDLASLSSIDYFTDGPQLVRAFNDTAHLR